jgi:XTP/dITP diphosphohydrolase
MYKSGGLLMKFIVATKNKGKVAEIKEILENFEVMTMTEAGINIDVLEDGKTFEENALKKAKRQLCHCFFHEKLVIL